MDSIGGMTFDSHADIAQLLSIVESQPGRIFRGRWLVDIGMLSKSLHGLCQRGTVCASVHS